MGWCSACKKTRPMERTEEGFLCCSVCGTITNEDLFSSEPTFFKSSTGQTTLSGSFIKTIESTYSESYERTLTKGRDEITHLVTSLDIAGGTSIIDQASAFYRIAVDRNFTRGRRTPLVAASCLYIVCRVNKKPYLLIDFSEELRVNVYELGAVFLQLCQLLRFEEHPLVTKCVDPSLFIHRFTDRLLGGKNAQVSRTALRILASMKRDWMQTGRKPTGLCGAALYISALSHGMKCSKFDIGKFVHVCKATLTKRLVEFENTESGNLTIEELNLKAEELEREARQVTNMGGEASGKTDLLCEHKGSGASYFRHGLCRNCYIDFVELSGGLEGGSDPPAFQQAEKKRTAQSSAKENTKVDYVDESTSVSIEHQIVEDHAFSEDMDNTAGDESDTLSEIDDAEVECYLNTEKEQQYKKIIWEKLNAEYLEEQKLKEEAKALNGSEDMVPKSRKKKQQKKDAEGKKAAPARTAAEATARMLSKKGLSSKVNFGALENLLGDSAPSHNTKKKRIESDSNDVDEQQQTNGEKECESECIDNNEKQDEEYEEYYNGETYGNEEEYGGYEANEEGYDHNEYYGNDEDYG